MTHAEYEDPRPASESGARIYVLRIWKDPSGERPLWRAAVRDGPNGERKYFADPRSCLEHLRRVLDEP